ncbi:MAG: DNA adenine methylase [Planctomycetaceae bacterium]|nr:DNA adenine methylase [Planctomycetaceae bacterium]
MAKLLEATIDLNGLRGAQYFEPYAGGAGAALALLDCGAVSKVHLNDRDARIFAFWRAAINQTSEMIDRVMSVPLNIGEWEKQRAICRAPSRHSQLDVGFAAFYMNRCNRSGVLTGAGPIGGLAQQGKWRLDVRFYRSELARRLATIGRNRKKIVVTRLDAIEFLKQRLPRGPMRRESFVYLDPPYVVKGKRLYLNAYEERDHKTLADYMLKQQVLPWIMSYDDTPLVRNLYRSASLAMLTIDYKLHNKRSADELVITPEQVVTPSTCTIAGKYRQLVAVA